MASERVFSDDETEKRFIQDICWVQKDHWLNSKMPWNTIHGIPWKRSVKLAKGAYGTVFVGVRLLAPYQVFAVKSINLRYPLTNPDKKRIRSQVNEINMLSSLRSKYILRCLGCGRSNGENGLEQKESLDVFLEYIVGGSLKHVQNLRNKPFEEDPYIKQYTFDVLKALQYMRQQRVVHGDIKMDNLMLGDDCVKLGDWGGSKELSADGNNLKKFLIGTAGFQAPEVRKETQQSYPSDIFSLGCTVIEMATGNSPALIVSIITGLHNLHTPPQGQEPRAQIPDKMSLECKDFLQHCLCQDPEDRWTAAELLHHPFITNRDKTNKLPYTIKVPDELRQFVGSILRPPRRMDPEPPDEQITKRVYRHLKGKDLSWWVNLAGCGPMEPPLYPPSPTELRNMPSSPDPLPSLVPDFTSKPDKDLLEAFRGLSPYAHSANMGTIVKTTDPVRHPQQNRTFAKESNADLAEAEQFDDSLLESANAMHKANERVYEEARKEAAKQQMGNDPDLQLFPQLTSPGKEQSEIGTENNCTLTFKLRLPDKILKALCRDNRDVDAVEPKQRKL